MTSITSNNNYEFNFSQIALVVFPIHKTQGVVVSIDIPNLAQDPKPLLTILSKTGQLVHTFFQQVFNYSGLGGKDSYGIHLKLFQKSGTETLTCEKGTCSSSAKGDDIFSLEFIAHAYTHGVMACGNSEICFKGETGALNEALPLLFSNVIKNWHNQSQFSSIDWKIFSKFDISYPVRMHYWKTFGESIFTQARTDNQSNKKFLDQYSRIPCHAFYLAVTNANEKPWGKVAQVWFEALRRLKAEDTFWSFRHRTIKLAKDTTIKKAITDAWDTVLLTSETYLTLIKTTQKEILFFDSDLKSDSCDIDDEKGIAKEASKS